MELTCNSITALSRINDKVEQTALNSDQVRLFNELFSQKTFQTIAATSYSEITYSMPLAGRPVVRLLDSAGKYCYYGDSLDAREKKLICEIFNYLPSMSHLLFVLNEDGPENELQAESIWIDEPLVELAGTSEHIPIPAPPSSEAGLFSYQGSPLFDLLPSSDPPVRRREKTVPSALNIPHNWKQFRKRIIETMLKQRKQGATSTESTTTSQKMTVKMVQNSPASAAAAAPSPEIVSVANSTDSGSPAPSGTISSVSTSPRERKPSVAHPLDAIFPNDAKEVLHRRRYRGGHFSATPNLTKMLGQGFFADQSIMRQLQFLQTSKLEHQ